MNLKNTKQNPLASVTEYKERKELGSTVVDQTISKSIEAQVTVLNHNDQYLDKLIGKITHCVNSELYEFARLEAEETAIGNVKDKYHKLSLVTNQVCKNLTGTVTFGCLDENSAQNDVVEYGYPIGVIFAVIPMTNPIPNSLFKILNAIKTRNSLIVSYPRAGVSVGNKLITLVQSLLEEAGISPNLIQSVPLPSDRAQAQKFMSHDKVNLILATGGQKLVRAALSSGNPAYAVGPGNVPAIVCKGANLSKAARNIVQSKSYDNGIICGSESVLIVEKVVDIEFMKQLEAQKAAVLSLKEKQTAISHWYDNDGSIRREIVGKSAAFLAELAGITRDYQILVLVLPCLKSEIDLLGKEKLAPFVALISVSDNELIPVANSVLSFDGAGHTAVVHTNDPHMIDKCAVELPAGRILANTPATFGMMGVSTELPLSFMLGSGSWGKNISTDAITWRHFLNIKRLALHVNDIKVPELS